MRLRSGYQGGLALLTEGTRKKQQPPEMASRKNGAGEKLGPGEDVSEEQEGSWAQAENQSEGLKKGLTWPERREEGWDLSQGCGTLAQHLRATRHKHIIEPKAENTKTK